MDEIQRILIKAGHKDLAQKYYEKVAATTIEFDNLPDDIQKELKKIDIDKSDILSILDTGQTFRFNLDVVFFAVRDFKKLGTSSKDIKLFIDKGRFSLVIWKK